MTAPARDEKLLRDADLPALPPLHHFTDSALRGSGEPTTFGFMAQVGTLDFQEFIHGRKTERAGGVEGSGHDYSYVSDKNTRLAFEKLKPVELAVTGAVRLFKALGKNQLLGNAVRVGPNQFPRIHNLTVRCAESLQIAMPTLYITNSPVMNAMTFGTNDDSFIVVHSALVDHFSDEELLSVIGHEAGHIHNSHVVYLTALFYLKQAASIFLKWFSPAAELSLASWKRRAEITCDRAGLLCSKDINVSKRALAKLALGSQKLYEEFNLEAFECQFEEGRDGVGKYAEITASHPWLSKRMAALTAFSESELYRKHAGVGPGGLSMHEVDDRVHNIIKVVG
ncbi:MAG: M48 family metallopeptidase [Byssovorax sp.]